MNATPRRRAFTITELLVVILVISVILLILSIAGRSVQDQMRTTVCRSNLRQIHLAITGYCLDHQGCMHPHRNLTKWESPITGAPLDSMDDQAYWGVGYQDYTGGREIFECPCVDELAGHNLALEPGKKVYASYGLNGFGRYNDGRWNDELRQEVFGHPRRTALFEQRSEGGHWLGRSLVRIPDPAGTILCQDSYESVLDGNGDIFDHWYQWLGHGKDYLRHQDRCSVLWMDGHIDLRPRAGWTGRWYIGYKRQDSPWLEH
jgi:prepilin-type N-terminal cleavage/methylation domain-containing protein/prepilin-type processing-associated H-X9-DG protein